MQIRTTSTDLHKLNLLDTSGGADNTYGDVPDLADVDACH